MDDKRQESQKTVVAFVAGLLIGGLLVWVFTMSPNDETAPENNTDNEVENTVDLDDDDATDSENTNSSTNDDENTTDASREPVDDTAQEPSADDFTFSVANQGAGTTVLVGESMRYPATGGWIVVHEQTNGVLGNALGAARYDTRVGLQPNTVGLLRPTVAGQTYAVVHYTTDGDREFTMGSDVPMRNAHDEIIMTTFTAQ